jgi:DNA polymerase III delta subunit
MADLSEETLKVSLFIGKRKEFNEEDVRKVLATDTEVSKEAILAALARKDISACLMVYRNFMSRFSDKKYYLTLLGDISRYFRNLLRASHMKYILHKPATEIEKTKGFNLWSYDVKKGFFQALETYSLEELKSACSHFYRMDRHIKSSGTETFRIYFERLLIALCRRTPLRRREKVKSLSHIPASLP